MSYVRLESNKVSFGPTRILLIIIFKIIYLTRWRSQSVWQFFSNFCELWKRYILCTQIKQDLPLSEVSSATALSHHLVSLSCHIWLSTWLLAPALSLSYPVNRKVTSKQRSINQIKAINQNSQVAYWNAKKGNFELSFSRHRSHFQIWDQMLARCKHSKAPPA